VKATVRADAGTTSSASPSAVFAEVVLFDPHATSATIARSMALKPHVHAVLATTRPDGRPHAAPVAFLVREDEVWMASVAGAARLRNMRHQPAASLVVIEGDGDAHVALIVEGPTTLHEDPQPVLNEWMRDAWRDRFGTELTWAGALIELEPTKVLSYGRGRVIRPD